MWFIIGFAIFIAIIWVIATRIWPHHITWKEGLAMLVIQSLLMGTVYFGSLYGKGYDNQILNGQVTRKYSEHVSCGHSYSCNCRQTCSGSGSSRSCSQTCSTCYEHSYDVDWVVQSTVGSVDIDRVNRQGTQEPSRWTAVYVGQPFAKESSYYNFIKASPFSVFNRAEIESTVAIPNYPGVYDYYKINRVIDFQSLYKHDNQLNDLLNEQLKTLGPEKKVNLVVVFHSLGHFFVEAYKNKNLGGKINDVTVMIDIDKDGTFKAVDVFSWSKEDIVNVKIRDSLLDVGKYNSEEISKAIASNIKTSYAPRSIKEFEYLEAEVELPDWAVWFLLIFGTLFPFVSAFVAKKYELFE
jgi:hypothetical protein